MGRPDTHVPNRLVDENVFLSLPREQHALPAFAPSRELLPAPRWEGRERAVECYWKAWELAFGNLRQPAPESPLIANFIDTAFNNCTFMWDSSFMTMFGRYGSRAFNFQRTLDNFYSRQHSDGFICREIAVADGFERFERHDPSSTGPNVMPWAEWEYYRHFQDRERLARVFPVLLAYAQWLRTYRTWPDGTYWSSGWGCGMDNQPRLPRGYHVSFDHGHLSWIDATLQQIIANKLLAKMAEELDRGEDTLPLAAETLHLTHIVNRWMWDDRTAFYYDRFRNGELSRTKSIGAYWALLAEVVSADNLPRFVEHLRNPAEFARPHRVPTLSADDPHYRADGGYWLGGVWAPTNYMVLRGLTAIGEHALAHDIGLNHLHNVVKVFEATGTLWENYAPESAAHGEPARGDFVGWTGLSPIAILLEAVFGLRANVIRNELVWDIRLLEEHGVDRYPFGPEAALHLHCARRASPAEEPVVTARSTRPVQLIVEWAGGIKTIQPTLPDAT
jgi:glycogen debranching enzyme